MKTYSKKIMQGAEGNSFLFKRSLLAISLLFKEKKQDCEYLKSWIISNYYSKYKKEINYVFNLDLEKNYVEYAIARHLANKIEYQYNKQMLNTPIAV